MPSRSHAWRGSSLSTGGVGSGLASLAVLLLLTLTSCAQPGGEPAPAPGEQAPVPVELPERCRGDGAVQTWLLLPLDPPQSELLTAYEDRQVIEFQATVIGSDDSPALQPHRRFILSEAAEGITLLLDYQGDPPPLIQGQSYRFIAWADLLDSDAGSPLTPTPTDPRELIPASRGYEVQIYDSAGLLFLGRTDVEEQDDPLGLRVSNAAGECPAAPAPQNACVQSRQVMPATIRWGDAELTLYPGEDGMLAYQGGVYSAALFRNRQVVYVEPPCEDYHEHQRSLRIDRVDPLPVLPTLAPITGTLTTTLPITLTAPLTETAP
ncbi:MAG TPA: hypothetical protein VL334_04520 [Anaerolineae bacterium]|nr:hypothetical protein [Anaerolineae bacterium]